VLRKSIAAFLRGWNLCIILKVNFMDHKFAWNICQFFLMRSWCHELCSNICTMVVIGILKPWECWNDSINLTVYEGCTSAVFGVYNSLYWVLLSVNTVLYWEDVKCRVCCWAV
jgi:hypothetical protein